jgi:hypothetical protein
MGRVLGAPTGWEEYDLAAIEQALGLLNAKHEYVLLTVEESAKASFRWRQPAHRTYHPW